MTLTYRTCWFIFLAFSLNLWRLELQILVLYFFGLEMEELKRQDFRRRELLPFQGERALQELGAFGWGAQWTRPHLPHCLSYSWTISRRWASCTAGLDRAPKRRCTTTSQPARPSRSSFSCWENVFGSKDLRSTVHSLTPKVRTTYTLLLRLFPSCCVDVHLLNCP